MVAGKQTRNEMTANASNSHFIRKSLKEPMELLLQLLLDGGRIEHEGHVYAMTEDGSLCVVMHDDDNNERPMKVDCDLAGFKKLADDIGHEEIWLQCCATVLESKDR